MNHKALYRKYRPTSFAQVVGQNEVTTILKNSIMSKSFAHAYLFSGTKGTGKTSVAKIFAKAINCEHSLNGEACNQCPSCQMINESHDDIDILEIDGASNNGVEEIRSIKNNVSLLPMNLKYKVYIIDEVHMLTTAAFNALLKTLEEPPKHIVFIFATTEPYKIPETIISRCQWLQFEKISQADLIKVFNEILKIEVIPFEPKALTELALLSDGSLRDGINSLEKVFNYSSEITLKSVNKLYNVISVDKKVDFLKAILKHDTDKIIAILNEISMSLSDFKKFLTEMLVLVQDLVLYRLTENIKISKYLSLDQIKSFTIVEMKDLKTVLGLFESVIALNLDNLNLRTLLIARILKLFDVMKQYDLSIKLEPAKEIKQEIVENKPVKEVTVSLDEKPKVETPQISDTILDEDMLANVLNVIVQADKDVRKEVKEQWLKIHQLIENNKFRNFSKIYLNTIISAASANALIIICDNIIQADLINKNFYFQEHRNFLNFILTKEYMVYALDRKQWKLVGQKYQSLLKNNQLPEAKAIEIPEVVASQTTETKSQTLAFLQNIFSEIEEI
ncbi:DNA polymerase III subunit gamma/tau [Spiroplasma platyhelix]|uniref:DNA polymerase III subunit gamma/tau n=1 Tax=Spiroplasma platyhelix PALS-1 TaxID=1276218 RepID=A0A846U228_9MOLU|nr:DNA polymerase III subunit gamma/tau [Spiroplasma platyhelix]MBE4704196.1 Holliday junction ATP-dependent DNA helicase RuvB [Spiroplasma platyhelix PALS-1]NKE38569.1 DNA polymerase III subunit gamma/tau [Spiroplasma platyhelix PALS-1]UJB28780.1 DNA polymerase III subunits gamma and tau [Spiroplasma platyhelix PALS-1]